MGLFRSKLSSTHAEILQYSTGMNIDELRPLFENIPLFVFQDRRTFQKHDIPDSIAFLVICGVHVVSTKSTFGGKVTYHT